MDVKGRFVGEPIEVDLQTISPGGLAGGGPACPGRFRWRGRTYQVARVLEQGRRLSHEGYVRQHRFRVETTDGLVAVIACGRQVKRRVNPWQLLTIEQPAGTVPPHQLRTEREPNAAGIPVPPPADEPPSPSQQPDTPPERS